MHFITVIVLRTVIILKIINKEIIHKTAECIIPKCSLPLSDFSIRLVGRDTGHLDMESPVPSFFHRFRTTTKMPQNSKLFLHAYVYNTDY
jgi:hypothetical protein